eukprot:5947173-Amphidinium_carterae.1
MASLDLNINELDLQQLPRQQIWASSNSTSTRSINFALNISQFWYHRNPPQRILSQINKVRQHLNINSSQNYNWFTAKTEFHHMDSRAWTEKQTDL